MGNLCRLPSTVNVMLKLSINTGKINLTSPEYPNTETDVSNNENACFSLIVASCLATYTKRFEMTDRDSRECFPMPWMRAFRR